MATNNAVNNGLSGATGTGSFAGSDSPTFTTQIDVDNINVNGNTISSTSGAINVSPSTNYQLNLTGTNTATYNWTSTSADVEFILGSDSNSNCPGITIQTGAITRTQFGITSSSGPLLFRNSSSGGRNAGYEFYNDATSSGTPLIKFNPGGVLDLNFGGIKFPATAVPSANANTLDDYEEGTFTPVLADTTTGGNTGTASTLTGSYTIIGNMVYYMLVIANIDTTGMTGGNTFYIRNFPFTGANNTYGFVAPIITNSVTFSGANYLSARIVSNSTHMYISNITSGAGSGAVQVSDILSTVSDIYITGSYRI